MLFKCLALEQPSLRCLNYIPGIVNTDMLKQAYDLNPEHYKSKLFIFFIWSENEFKYFADHYSDWNLLEIKIIS
jgi:hypothetical protein